jgi:hypothetical protein
MPAPTDHTDALGFQRVQSAARRFDFRVEALTGFALLVALGAGVFQLLNERFHPGQAGSEFLGGRRHPESIHTEGGLVTSNKGRA